MAVPLTPFEKDIFLKTAFATSKVKTVANQLAQIKATQTSTILQHIYLVYLDEIYNNNHVREEILLGRKHLNLAMLGIMLQQEAQ